MPPNNFLHEENLDYVLEIVNSELFGEPLYPSVADKTAVYCFSIITNHTFTDGNKRTGLLAALNFLNINKFDLNEAVSNQILTDFIIEIASGKTDLDQCKIWFAQNIVPL